VPGWRSRDRGNVEYVGLAARPAALDDHLGVDRLDAAASELFESGRSVPALFSVAVRPARVPTTQAL
jgi:hypothetical protein